MIFPDLKKSSHAEPSLKNSGFEQKSMFLFLTKIFLKILSIVYGGTVDLITNKIFSFSKLFLIWFKKSKICLKLVEPFSFDGVPKHIKMIFNLFLFRITLSLNKIFLFLIYVISFSFKKGS